MTYKTIQVKTTNDDVVTITLNRPDVHNALNPDMITELTHCFQHYNEDPTIRIIILTGNGPSFCAGADLNWMKNIKNYTQKENQEDSQTLQTMYDTINTSPKPVIGRINGNAFGGGLGLIAVCDITIGIKETIFAFSEVKLGIIPSIISTYITPRMRLSDIRRYFITGERFNAQTAHTIGLLDYVTTTEELDTTVNTYINQLRTSAPHAITEIKKLLQTYQNTDLKHYKKYTVDTITKLRTSEEGQEGITAFLEKRKPKWSK